MCWKHYCLPEPCVQNNWPHAHETFWKKPVSHTHQWPGNIRQLCWRILQWRVGPETSVWQEVRHRESEISFLCRTQERAWVGVAGNWARAFHLSDACFYQFKDCVQFGNLLQEALLPNSRERNEGDKFSTQYFPIDFLPFPPWPFAQSLFTIACVF